jgi:hypothetical protein
MPISDVFKQLSLSLKLPKAYITGEYVRNCKAVEAVLLTAVRRRPDARDAFLQPPQHKEHMTFRTFGEKMSQTTTTTTTTSVHEYG